MDLRITYSDGRRVLWYAPIEEALRYAELVALARLWRPYEARRLQADVEAVHSRRSVEFAGGAGATLLGDTTLVVTTDWGKGPRLEVYAPDPIAFAINQMAEGIRPALTGIHGTPTVEFDAGDRDPRDLMAVGSHVLDTKQRVLASSDAGCLPTHDDAARLLSVLMDRADEYVPHHELKRRPGVTDPERVVRDLQQLAADVRFPLPVALVSGSAAFIRWPTPCKPAVVDLTDRQLHSFGLGQLAGHHVSVGHDNVIVRRPDLMWARYGQIVEPTAADQPWKLAIFGSGIPGVVEDPLECHPCGLGGLRAAIVHVVADPRPDA